MKKKQEFDKKKTLSGSLVCVTSNVCSFYYYKKDISKEEKNKNISRKRTWEKYFIFKEKCNEEYFKKC